MAKFPKKLRIGAVDYTIKRIPDLTNDRNDPMWGMHAPGLQEIHVSDGVKNDREVYIIFHEILHAIFDQYYIKRGDEEEKIVDNVSTGLASLFKNNPKLLKYMVEAYQ